MRALPTREAADIQQNPMIATAGQNHPEILGIRVTPNVYTTLDEIDRFGDKVLAAIKNGIT